MKSPNRAGLGEDRTLRDMMRWSIIPPPQSLDQLCAVAAIRGEKNQSSTSPKVQTISLTVPREGEGRDRVHLLPLLRSPGSLHGASQKTKVFFPYKVQC